MSKKIIPLPAVEVVKDPLLRAILIAVRENMKYLSTLSTVNTITQSTTSGRSAAPATVDVTPDDVITGSGGSGGSSGGRSVVRSSPGQSGLSSRDVMLGIVCDANGAAMLDTRGHPLFSIDYGVLA